MPRFQFNRRLLPAPTVKPGLTNAILFFCRSEGPSCSGHVHSNPHPLTRMPWPPHGCQNVRAPQGTQP